MRDGRSDEFPIFGWEPSPACRARRLKDLGICNEAAWSTQHGAAAPAERTAAALAIANCLPEELAPALTWLAAHRTAWLQGLEPHKAYEDIRSPGYHLACGVALFRHNPSIA